MLSSIILALLSINICTASSQLQIRDPCDDQHALCIPEEAEDYETPSVRTGIKYLLVDLMSSVTSYAGARRDVKYGREPLVGRAPSDDLCCLFGDSCYLLGNRRAPFCYNERTTDFVLPGNFTGNINTGQYEAPNGDRANLYSGNYILEDGRVGNIYDSVDPQDRYLPTRPRSTVTVIVPPRPTTTTSLETEVFTKDGTTIAQTTYFSAVTFTAHVSDGIPIIPAVTFPAVIAEGTTVPQSRFTIIRTLPPDDDD